MPEQQLKVTMGRPPIPENKRRNKRLVGMFSSDEMVEIEAYMDREEQGPSDTVREAVLRHVRAEKEGGAMIDWTASPDRRKEQD